MIVKIHQANTDLLQHANDLLRAHQVVIDTWYEAWAKEQRSKAIELLRRRHQGLSENYPER